MDSPRISSGGSDEMVQSGWISVVVLMSVVNAAYSEDRVGATRNLSFQGTEVNGAVAPTTVVSRTEKLRQIQKKHRLEFNELRMKHSVEMEQFRETSSNLRGSAYLGKLQEIHGRQRDAEDDLSRKQEREICEQIGIACEPTARSQVTSVETVHLD